MGQVFKAKVRRIGNSLGVLIPSDVARKLEVDRGDEVSISITDLTPDEMGSRLKAMCGAYKGRGPFEREKEDRY